ncbi:hypothetical protein P170DRAFT_474494 [Aspergillus steynii IBT 23096]|uniref:Uncharacterized protein n=1 Tax=Aspergillus steynii IBT 23096 TaxID=1392250 RepID=A0A2I2GDH2_9EURO|nr:uncharacterized protein P170DRAFT_474494 [Aspergillus steynii IBT 23096]PLB50945.1 hypothetical protein P170DRAFT_474494 [Aspergillus steynii IBT 23096]
MTMLDSPHKTEDEQLLSKSPAVRIKKLVAPFRNASPKWNTVILDTWTWEIISMAFSILFFLAIVGVLGFYDQRKMPDLPQGLTLNTVVSILATGSKSALLCMIGTSMGQLKWLWFSGRKSPLYDLQFFDDASRGPWGSMMALLKWPQKGHLLITLGALITVVSLAFDPFTQQIFKFPVRNVPSDTSNATAKQAILPWIPTDGIDSRIFDAMNAGIYSADFELDPVCPSGNCTWPPFQSAGWCSKCEDVTAQATPVGCDITSFNTSRHEDQNLPCNITFPDGSWINVDLYGYWNEMISAHVLSIPMVQVTRVNNEIKGPHLNQTILGVYSPLSAFVLVEFRDLTAPVATTYSVEQLQERTGITHATECVLSPCVRTYNVSVSGGVPSTRSSLPDFGEIFHPEHYPGMKTTPQNRENIDQKEYEKSSACWKPDQGQSVDVMLTTDTWPTASNLWRNNTKFAGCPVHDCTEFIDLVGTISSPFVYNGSEQFWQYPDPDQRRLWPRSPPALQHIISSGFAHVMENIAASSTKYARNISNQMAYGTVYEPQTYVIVDWLFLTLPAVLVALGIVFLASTIIVNSRQNLSLWKSSVFPMMYNELMKEMDIEGSASASSMERTAREITVKLEVSDTGKRMLVAQRS